MTLIDDAAAPVSAPIATLQRPGKPNGTAVGRDPWFLNSLQTPAAGNTTRAASGAPVVSTPAPAPANAAAPAATAITTATSRAMPAAPPAAPARAATAEATATAPVRHHNSAAPAAGSVSSATLTLQLLASHGAVPAVQPRRQRQAPAGNRKTWARDKLSVLHTAAGLEIVARNYFADEPEQQRFIATLLATLQAAGKLPQRLTFNGRLIWPQPSQTNSASGAHHAG